MDWHPHNQNLFVCGSLEGQVRIFDISTPKLPKQSLESLDKVHTVRWWPWSKDMIVAGTKNLALVWHRKRPHLYQYVFRGHKDVVTAIEWDNTFNYLITGSKDKRVVIQEIAGGYRPQANLNTTAIDFNVYEDLAQVDDIIGSRDPERFLKDLEGGGGKRS